jgi:hypothetical protein
VSLAGVLLLFVLSFNGVESQSCFEFDFIHSVEGLLDGNFNLSQGSRPQVSFLRTAKTKSVEAAGFWIATINFLKFTNISL